MGLSFMVTKSTPTTFEKIELALKISTFLAVVSGGLWAIYQYHLTGSDNWTNNIVLETKVLPYHDELRLLVVHVKSKNPSKYAFELDSKSGDSFELRIRNIATDAKKGTVIGEDEGTLINKVDLMQSVDGEYQLLPGAEVDDMRTIVLPVNTIVQVTAEMKIHNGTTDKHGKPDTDNNWASTVVRVES